MQTLLTIKTTPTGTPEQKCSTSKNAQALVIKVLGKGQMTTPANWNKMEHKQHLCGTGATMAHHCCERI